MKKKAYRFVVLLFVNLIVFFVLFLALELSYRIYHDGFPNAFIRLVNSFQKVPYSNLGTSNWVIYDKEIGYRLNPMRDEINSLSVRHREIDIPKPENIYRIIYLGDSIPWDQNGFVKHTRDFLKDKGYFEVINAGIPGYTSYQEVLFYKKYLKSAAPDLVIWTYCLNDNHRFLHRFDKKGQMLWTDEAKRTLYTKTIWNNILSRSYLLSQIRLGIISKINRYKDSKYKFSWERKTDFNIAWKDYSWSNYEKDLLDLKYTLDRQDSKLAIVIFPYEPQIFHRDNKENHDYVLKPQHNLRALCEKHHVPCLDLYPKFASEYSTGKTLFRDGIHLNKEGHLVSVQEILKFLLDHRLLSFQ